MGSKKGVRRRGETPPTASSLPLKKTLPPPHAPQEGGWSPQFKTCFYFFLLFRVYSSFFNNIADCDESMNYWEPTHYLMYGYGLQTWEYSPVYALRSYLYIMIHAFFGNIVSVVFGSSKTTVFYCMRMMLGAVSAYAEAHFSTRVSKRFGPTVGLFTFVFLLGSSGMAQAAPSYLPTTFTMYAFLLAYGHWFSREYARTVFFAVVGVFLGWPFGALIILPMALDVLLRKPTKAFVYAIASVSAVMIPMLFVDYMYYQKLVVAVWNIAVYNAAGGDSVLFGVEPWNFYFFNAFLNFNIVFVLFLVAIPLLAYFVLRTPQLYFGHAIYLSGAYLWFGALSTLPHKEERFLYPIYPLICLGAALAMYFVIQIIMQVSSALLHKKWHRLSNLCEYGVTGSIVTVIVIYFALSLARSTGQQKYYHAPMNVWGHLHDIELARGDESSMLYKTDSNTINICVGKEWYRFPSHFFIPHSKSKVHQKFKFNFIKSSYDGLLPKYYAPLPNGTWTIPTTMNNQNKEEMDRYIDPSACHYLVDFDYPGQAEKHYANEKVGGKPELGEEEGVWEPVYSEKFLVQGLSPSLYRAFWFPFISDKRITYSDYYLLRNSRLMKPKKKK